MAKASPLYECTACGARHLKAMGKCTGCGAWDTVQEVRGALKRDLQRAGSAYAQSHYSGPVALPDVDVSDTQRTPTGIRELDRVLGGGVVPGMVALLGGEPGIGKSTRCCSGRPPPRAGCSTPAARRVSARSSCGPSGWAPSIPAFTCWRKRTC